MGAMARHRLSEVSASHLLSRPSARGVKVHGPSSMCRPRMHRHACARVTASRSTGLACLGLRFRRRRFPLWRPFRRRDCVWFRVCIPVTMAPPTLSRRLHDCLALCGCLIVARLLQAPLSPSSPVSPPSELSHPPQVRILGPVSPAHLTSGEDILALSLH
jgi:hypothetical protein